jgi:2-keto-3-deoxy-L-rhamnonate aldolase RhmA
MVGTFLKTPAHLVVEVLAGSKLDFVCLDAEHAAFDRAALDACCAVGRALDFPVLVRVPDGTPHHILAALDSGAIGVVVPHVASPETARGVARAARFGPGGRGFAGATRWADFGGHGMGALIERSRRETVVIAQIEEPEGVEACEAIAAVDGIDGLFVGPSDLSVGYGLTAVGGADLDAAMTRVGAAARANGRALATWTAGSAQARDWARTHGVDMFLIASELNWMRQGADSVVDDLQGPGSGGEGAF